jgi:hypothetical protein
MKAREGDIVGVEFLMRKSGSLRLLAAVTVSLTAFLGSSVAALAEQGYVLTQKSTKMGDQYLYLSSEGIKITNPRAGFNLVARAPNWDITLYNDKTRCFYQTTAERYRQELAGRSPDGELKNSTWSKMGDTYINGLKATEYRMGSKTVRSKTKAGGVVSKTINGAQYWVASEITIPAKLTELLAAAYGLPSQTSACVPLRLKYSESTGDHLILDTYRVDKAPIPVAYFDKPAGYKPVTSDAEVMMNDEQKQIMSDMARDLGSDPQGAQLKNKIDQVRSGGANPSSTFTKDDVNKLMDIFKKKQAGSQ